MYQGLARQKRESRATPFFSPVLSIASNSAFLTSIWVTFFFRFRVFDKLDLHDAIVDTVHLRDQGNQTMIRLMMWRIPHLPAMNTLRL
ncbi:MAG: hypothetical protein CVU57_19720 [Deltaproteobacteria bacterium HGW-Deltaproteobacteria-15]|jgi:hypothetical protein|nr:MAG: hypothetical protein CVU57_19720 [Deltaproteobacteria bacterium HGW-Deltaproteobacteria-15]